MYKIIKIAVFICLLTSGCSVFRKTGVTPEAFPPKENSAGVIKSAVDNNISTESYFIKKADIEVFSQDQRDNVVATVKYDKNGEYLISIRSKTGIEAARGFIGKDTILINDRINRILYTGKQGYIEKKFGIPVLILPLVFGDFLKGENDGKIDSTCVDGRMSYITYVKNVRITSIIDCNRNKIVSSVIESGRRNELINLVFSEFRKTGSKIYPGVIDISGLPDRINMHIEIKSIEIPWLGELDFIPGSKYEIVEIK